MSSISRYEKWQQNLKKVGQTSPSEYDFFNKDFGDWRNKCREVYMKFCSDNPTNIEYLPWILNEYKAFEVGITSEEFVKEVYFKVYFKDVYREEKIKELLDIN